MEATDGRIDYFLTHSSIPEFAAFAFEFPMQDNVAAMFGDDKTGVFEKGMRNYIESTFSADPTPNYNESYLNYDNLFMGFVMENSLNMNSKNRYPLKERIHFERNHKRKYYPESGVLICRGTKISATFKLIGSTGIGHDHNDAGTYQIMKNGVIIAGDVGGPNYYEGEWKDRYKKSIFNSYGHPLPVVGKQLQIQKNISETNRRSQPLFKLFTDDVDVINFDLKFFYNYSSLLNLTRTNTFVRTPGKQSVTIEDTVLFSKPSKFAVAVLSREGFWIFKKKSKKQLIGDFILNGTKLNVIVNSLTEFKYSKEKQKMNGVEFTRIGIIIKNRVLHERVTVIYN